MQFQTVKGLKTHLPVNTYSVLKQLIDADAAPTVDHVHVNGVQTDITCTVTQLQDNVPANIVGRYMIEVDTAALEFGDQVVVSYSAEVDGFRTQNERSIIVISDDKGLPYID